MTAVRPGVWFQGGLKIPIATELARQAEAAGVDSIWLAEGPIARDAFLTLASIAGATSRVELATGVVNPFTRHPAQLAATFAALDELSGGELSVALAWELETGSSHWALTSQSHTPPHERC